MNNLLRLQELDLRIEVCREREVEIPKQKSKFDVQRQRLKQELEECERALTALQVEQRNCESEIAQLKQQVGKYEGQLAVIKKNEEYQALLHEIEAVKRQVGQREERVIAIMVEIDETKSKLAEDRKRIEAEQSEIDAQCKEIDAELAEAVTERKALETERVPLLAAVDRALVGRYERIRSKVKRGPAAVPMRNGVCGGCNMAVTAQVGNEVLAGKTHSCSYCGRLVYNPDSLSPETTHA